jgi:hypothetical protein
MGERIDARRFDDRLARDLRGFGPVGVVAIILIYFGNGLIKPLSALLVLLWAWRSGTPWREIGLARPKSWLSAIALGLLLGTGFKLVMKALVMPLLGAPPVNQAYHYLAGNTAAMPAVIFLVLVVAGFGEEMLFRGFAFERFGKLLGDSAGAKVAIVLLTALWFGLEHVPNQGLAGFQQGIIVGLVFGTAYAASRQLWPLIAAHAAFDLTAVAIIFFDVEREVAGILLG